MDLKEHLESVKSALHELEKEQNDVDNLLDSVKEEVIDVLDDDTLRLKACDRLTVEVVTLREENKRLLEELESIRQVPPLVLPVPPETNYDVERLKEELRVLQEKCDRQEGEQKKVEKNNEERLVALDRTLRDLQESVEKISDFVCRREKN